jgi:hypothetical protein
MLVQTGLTSTGQTATDVVWHEYDFIVVGSGADTLSFISLTTGSAGPSLDSVRMVAIPEPSSFVLAALGLIGLVVWRRR